LAHKLLKTPLYNAHIKSGAKIIPFAGWNMPLQYKNGILFEVRAVRTSVGMFDVSHMGRIEFYGKNILSILEKIMSINIYSLTEGKCKYNLICNDAGGIIDDTIISRLKPNLYSLVVNAVNTVQVTNWMKKHGGDESNMAIKTYDTSMIAVQGPKSNDVINKLSKTPINIERFSITETKLSGIQCLISRTGYTGEDGFEIICSSVKSNVLWQSLLESGVTPCGLGARDVLRIEAGLPLHGNDISEAYNPFQSQLHKFVSLHSEKYVAKKSLKKIKSMNLKNQLVGIKLTERGIPRKGHNIFINDSKQSKGSITSGTFSPTISSGIGLGYICSKYSAPGTKVKIDIRGKKINGVVVNVPFFKKIT
tara:strand:+ start:993 stop:2084 length:1092 start_codon:yes stop_codon:yes gene_type:complete